MIRLRNALIAFFTFIGGAYFFLEFVLPKQFYGFTFGAYHQELLRGLQVISVMTIGLGILSILRIHGGNILRRAPGMMNSLVLLVGFFTMLIFQAGIVSQEVTVNSIRKRFEGYNKFLAIVAKERETAAPAPRIEALKREIAQVISSSDLVDDEGQKISNKLQHSLDEFSLQLQGGSVSEENLILITTEVELLGASLVKVQSATDDRSTAKRGEALLNNGLFIPLGSAMFALLAFYIATAAYRSFRVRSFESSLLMAAAVVVMLGQIPQGPLYISESLPTIRLWMLKNVSTPAFRAIFFGSAVAGLAMGLRIWLSLEKGPLSESE